MSKTDNDKDNLTSLPKKWDNILKKMPEFKEQADAASVEELKKIIVDCEGNIFTTNKEEEADVKLSAAKEMVKTLSEPHKEARKYQQAKIQYALLCLENAGVDLDNTNNDK